MTCTRTDLLRASHNSEVFTRELDPFSLVSDWVEKPKLVIGEGDVLLQLLGDVGSERSSDRLVTTTTIRLPDPQKHF